MGWARTERAALGASVALLFGCAAIGFRWIRSPYLTGYAAAAGGFYALSRLAAALADGHKRAGRSAGRRSRPAITRPGRRARGGPARRA